MAFACSCLSCAWFCRLGWRSAPKLNSFLAPCCVTLGRGLRLFLFELGVADRLPVWLTVGPEAQFLLVPLPRRLALIRPGECLLALLLLERSRISLEPVIGGAVLGDHVAASVVGKLLPIERGRPGGPAFSSAAMPLTPVTMREAA